MNESDDEGTLGVLRGIISDRNLRFPAHPCLVPDVHVFTMPDGLGIQFRGGPFPTVLRGPRAQASLEFLLPLLDGTRSVAAISEAVPESLDRATVLRTLVLLHQKGLLVGPRAEAEGILDGRQSSQRAFWGRHLDVTRNAATADEVQNRITGASIILVGTGLFGTLVYEGLVRTGFTGAMVAAWNDDGGLAAAAREGPEPARDVLHCDTTDPGELLPWIEQRLPQCELLVVATRNASDGLARGLNRLCLDAGVPWLRANDAGTQVEIGPLMVPEDGPCFRCMELRRGSTRADAVEEHLYQEELERPRPSDTISPRGEAFPFAMLAAGFVVSEVTRVATKATFATLLGQVCLISQLSGEIEQHRFLRVPRCPECAGRRAPLSEVTSGG